MIPKEHGAYGQLLFPIVTALAIGRPGVAAAALAGAAVCAFLAHEPLLVLLGQRGSRAERELRQTATKWFGAFAVLAAALAIVAYVNAPPRARLALIAPLALTVIVGAVILSGRERTVAGEAVSAIALASLAYPVGAWSGASSRASLSCAAAFGVVFVVGIVCVHAVIGFTRRPPARPERVTGVATTIGTTLIVSLLASGRVLEIVTPIAVLPACLAGLVLVIRPPSARNLRVVGWTLVATSLLTMAVLLAAFR